MTSTKIRTLLAWCSANGIHIDPRLEITELEGSGITVCSLDAYIRNLTTLVRIPKTAVLSVRSCSLAEFITPIPYGHGAHLALALALYGETLRNEESRWFGYLQSLPQEVVSIALFWGLDEQELYDADSGTTDDHADRLRQIEDGKEAAQWMRGTEIEKPLQISEEHGLNLLEEIRQYYFAVVEPLMGRLHQRSTMRDFYHAYSLVSSRAFLIDAYHGLAMVPIADAFNHSQENHVHLESDHDVCTTCGSLYECPHDTEDSNLETHPTATSAVGSTQATACIDVPRAQSGNLEPDTYDMVSNAPIHPRSEVFNTYGEKLTNAQLLARYGFALDENDSCAVTWDLEDLWKFAADYKLSSGERDNRIGYTSVASLTKWYLQIIEQWPSNLAWADSGLVYNSSCFFEDAVSNCGAVGGLERANVVLCLNEDGKISHQTWVYCGLLNLTFMADIEWSGADDILPSLREMTQFLLSLEKEIDDTKERGEDVCDGRDPSDPSAVGRRGLGCGLFLHPRQAKSIPALLAATCRTIASLCRWRRDMAEKGGIDAEGLGAVLDGLPAHQRRTRMAVMEVLSERSLLESCESGWSEISERLDEYCTFEDD